MDKVDLRQRVYKSYILPAADQPCPVCVYHAQTVTVALFDWTWLICDRKYTICILSAADQLCPFCLINPYVDVFTLLDGYQELGTSRREMTECNWQGVLKKLSSDLHRSHDPPPKKNPWRRRQRLRSDEIQTLWLNATDELLNADSIIALAKIFQERHAIVTISVYRSIWSEFQNATIARASPCWDA